LGRHGNSLVVAMNLPIFPSVASINLILGDQLNHEHSWFTEPREDTLFVIAELYEEASYVPHHAQKICAFFLAMQKFAESLAALEAKTLKLRA